MVPNCNWDVRLARPEELSEIAEAQAAIALMECGVDPMDRDREGFMRRVLRIEQNRVFVVYEDNKLIFKADIIAETTDSFIGRVYVAPEYRGQGIDPAACKLTLNLLKRVQNVCF